MIAPTTKPPASRHGEDAVAEEREREQRLLDAPLDRDEDDGQHEAAEAGDEHLGRVPRVRRPAPGAREQQAR